MILTSCHTDVTLERLLKNNRGDPSPSLTKTKVADWAHQKLNFWQKLDLMCTLLKSWLICKIWHGFTQRFHSRHRWGPPTMTSLCRCLTFPPVRQLRHLAAHLWTTPRRGGAGVLKPGNDYIRRRNLLIYHSFMKGTTNGKLMLKHKTTKPLQFLCYYN